MSEGTVSSDGPALYRLQRRTSDDERHDIWVQIRRWFRWRDHYHVDNERRKAVIDVLDHFEQLIEALEKVEQCKDDVKKANKKISQHANERKRGFFSPGGDVSNRFRGPRVRPEQELPDRTDEYKQLVKRYKLDKLLKGGAFGEQGVPEHTTAYYLENQPPPDKEFINEQGAIRAHGWRTQNQQRQGKNRGGGSNSQNQN